MYAGIDTGPVAAVNPVLEMAFFLCCFYWSVFFFFFERAGFGAEKMMPFEYCEVAHFLNIMIITFEV